MAYGIVEYTHDGKPICEICGLAFHRLLKHVVQKHDMTEKEYKKMHGLDIHKGISSKESAKRSRKATLANYDKCIATNLNVNGSKTKFKRGNKARSKDKISPQSLNKLVDKGKKRKAMNLLLQIDEKIETKQRTLS